MGGADRGKAVRIVILARPEARNAALTLAKAQIARDVRILLIDNEAETPIYDRDGDIRIQQGIEMRPHTWLNHAANRSKGLSKGLSRWFANKARKRTISHMKKAWIAELTFLQADQVLRVGDDLPSWAKAASPQTGSPLDS